MEAPTQAPILRGAMRSIAGGLGGRCREAEGTLPRRDRSGRIEAVTVISDNVSVHAAIWMFQARVSGFA
jgi:hypothetical protein